MRLIDAESLARNLGISFESFDCEECEQFDRQHGHGTCKKGSEFEEVCFRLENEPTVEPKARWIPCARRLPDTDEKVLCCTLTKKGIPNILVGYYLANPGRWVSGMNGNVVAWMPLPKPYKEGKT